MENRFSACELMEMGARIEENGRAFYLALCDMSQVSQGKTVFRALALAEEQHKEFFRNLSKESCNFEPVDTFPEDYFAYLRSLADQYVFTVEDKGEEIAKSVTTYQEAIDLGIKFEKDSILFYQQMRQVLIEKDRQVMDKIIEEEKNHLRKLIELKKTI
jgi:rubrerythrin